MLSDEHIQNIRNDVDVEAEDINPYWFDTVSALLDHIDALTAERARAALILEAAEQLYVELNDAAFGWDMVPLKVQRDAREALDRWRALVGER